MARVKRFIYNSDFMTIARVGSTTVTATIPGKECNYSGTIEIPVDIPDQAWARFRIEYTGTSGPKQYLACQYFFYINATKNGKQISYLTYLTCKKGKLVIEYSVNNLTDASSPLVNSQTFTLHIDFMRQPNT
jgi:hypothetical protein